TVSQCRQFAAGCRVSLQHLRNLHRALQTFRGEGGDVYGVVVKCGGGEAKVVEVQDRGDIVTDERLLLQAAEGTLHGDRLMTTAHVDAADAERHHGADAGFSEGLVGAVGGLSSLEFETGAVIEGVAIGFVHRDHHVLARLGAVGVLDGRVHLLEKAEVVEAALTLQHVLLAQGSAWLHPDCAAGDSGPGMVQPIEKKLTDKKLLAFMNRKGYANPR